MFEEYKQYCKSHFSRCSQASHWSPQDMHDIIIASNLLGTVVFQGDAYPMKFFKGARIIRDKATGSTTDHSVDSLSEIV